MRTHGQIYVQTATRAGGQIDVETAKQTHGQIDVQTATNKSMYRQQRTN